MKLLFSCLFLLLSSVGLVHLDDDTTDLYNTTENNTYFNEVNETTVTQISTERPNYCKELAPYCSCLLSRYLIKCDNFNNLTQLNFASLNTFENETKRIFELELNPTTSLELNDELNLNGLEIYGRVVLRNFQGFDLNSNPFESARFNNSIKLYLYNSIMKTIDNNQSCLFSNLDPNFKPLFSSFEYIIFGQGIEYTDQLCPLIFQNSIIEQLEVNYLNSTNMLNFIDLFDNSTINSSIKWFKIYASFNLSIKKNFFNKQVFENLRTLEIDYSSLTHIDENAFEDLNKLRNFYLTLENFITFIRSSSNKWMKSLNSNVTVDYSNIESVTSNRNKTLILHFNTRSNGQDYTYPDEDLEYFKYFPHDQFVFTRILALENIPCSNTLKFLLKNARSYPTISTLNTTSTYKCFLDSTTTVTSFSTESYTDENNQTMIITDSPIPSHSSDSSSTSTSSISTTKESTSITKITTTTVKKTDLSSQTTIANQTTTTTTTRVNDKVKTVSLGAFLATVIPLVTVLVISITVIIILIFKLKSTKSVIYPTETYPL